jgi:hypothetical protein
MLTTGLAFGAQDDSPALPSIPFDKPGEYEFHFRQAHRREMSLMLVVDGREGEVQRAELTSLHTVIEVWLTDHRGRTVCKAAGLPHDGITKDAWVLRGLTRDLAFWHWSCTEIKLKRSQLYTLRIQIHDLDPKSPKVKLTPKFERSDDYGP